MTGLRNSATTSRMMPIDSASRRFRWLGRRRAGAKESAIVDKLIPSRVDAEFP
jgi:hypothetical protein